MIRKERTKERNKRITVLILMLGLFIAPFAKPIQAEEKAPETVIIVPLDVLPSYGSLVSAWYKQSVYDPSGKKVGVIADMLFSPDGSINAVMLNVGGFLGIGQKHVAVPVSAISVTQKKGKSWLTINTTKDVVKKAVGYKFDKKSGIWNPQ
jgi:sporulation protein YlmC with PRC-barrel domain